MSCLKWMHIGKDGIRWADNERKHHTPQKKPPSNENWSKGGRLEERCVYSLIHPWASRIVPSPNCHNKKKLLHKAAPQDFECLYAFLLLLSRASSSSFAILIVGVHKVPRELFLRVATIFPFLYPIARRYRLEVLHFDSNPDPFFIYVCVSFHYQSIARPQGHLIPSSMNNI